MIYHGLVIAAEEQIFNILGVDDVGELECVVTEDWTERVITYAVFRDENCEADDCLKTGLDDIDAARKFIRQFQADCMHINFQDNLTGGRCSDCGLEDNL